MLDETGSRTVVDPSGPLQISGGRVVFNQRLGQLFSFTYAGNGWGAVWKDGAARVYTITEDNWAEIQAVPCQQDTRWDVNFVAGLPHITLDH